MTGAMLRWYSLLWAQLAYDVELAGGRGLAYRIRKGSFYGVNGRQCCLATLQGWCSGGGCMGALGKHSCAISLHTRLPRRLLEQ